MNKNMKITSLELKHNESFYNILFKYFAALSKISLNVTELIAATVFIVVVSYMFYRIHDYRHKRFINQSKCDVLELQKLKDYTRLIIRHQSIISHKEMLNTLEYAADKCYNKIYALKCIDIIVQCPQLVNVKSSPHGLTSFHRVCFQGHKSLIAFMLAKGADPFLTTVTGENALCMAVYYFLNKPTENDFSCLDLLVQTGCGFGLNNQWYNTLLETAFDNNHTKLVQWLILHHKVLLHKRSRCFSTPRM